MKQLLWVDGYRDFSDELCQTWLSSNIEGYEDYSIYWVKSVEGFSNHISALGMPDAICLGDDLIDGNNSYDCVVNLMNYCMDNGNPVMPQYYYLTVNPELINKMCEIYASYKIYVEGDDF